MEPSSNDSDNVARNEAIIVHTQSGHHSFCTQNSFVAIFSNINSIIKRKSLTACVGVSFLEIYKQVWYKETKILYYKYVEIYFRTTCQILFVTV